MPLNFPTPQLLWKRFVISQKAAITDSQYISDNVFRFVVAAAFSFLSLAVNAIALALHKTRLKYRKSVHYSPFILAIAVSGALVLNNVIGALCVRKWRLPRPRYHFTVFHFINAICALAGLGGAIYTLQFTATQSSRVSGRRVQIFVTLDVFSLIVQCFMVGTIAFVSYGSTFLTGAKASKLVILVLGVVQILLAIVTMLYNWSPYTMGEVVNTHAILPLFQMLAGGGILGESLVALTICISVRQIFGISVLTSRLIMVHTGIWAFTTVYAIVIWGLSLYQNAQDPDSSSFNSIVIGICLVTMALVAGCVVRLQQVPKSNLHVARFDLFALSPSQRRQLADRISSNRRIGEPDGPHALGLMTGFSSWVGTNISCSVVRVYHDGPQKEPEQSTLTPFRSRDSSSYDKVKAWQGLDEENWIFQDGQAIRLTNSISQPAPAAPKPPPITKSKRKRLEKKYKAEGMSKEEIDRAIEAEIAAMTGGEDDEAKAAEDEGGLPADEFKAILEHTEALVLLTCVDKFDLTQKIGGKFGAFIQKLFGEGSHGEWLVVRLGLIGAHWPFRPGIFRLSKTKRPVARHAAILRALTDWNDRLPSKERFGFILAPHYKDDSHARSITPGGWRQIDLPPTHIIDLRPYSNLDLKEYLKAIKYRDQAKTFEREGGEVVVSDQFAAEEVDMAYNLWKSVAHKRVSEGHTAVLAEPDTKLLNGFSNPVVREGGTWSLMFLKVNGMVVASCVLVRLGDTLTSDIQGLDYEEGHRLKAYFTMMQATIDIALKDKISFVEFGPSTAKPKLDIGSSSIPMLGALYVRNPILSAAVKFAAGSVSL